MASSGPRLPTNSSDGGGANGVWTDPSYVNAEDSRACFCAASDTYSNTLITMGYGFTLPAGAVVDGIEVQIKCARFSSGSVTQVDNIAKLVIGGSQAGNNKADTVNTLPYESNARTIGGSTWFRVYGGAADKWGLTPTAAQVNAADFGFAWRVYSNGKVGVINVGTDAIRITVWYTATSSPRTQTVVIA
jgi:hypothetical protein